MTRAQKLYEELLESFVGNTVIPELQDKGEDEDISTRQKAIAVLSAYKSQAYNTIIKWLESIEDKEYNKFHKQWLQEKKAGWK